MPRSSIFILLSIKTRIETSRWYECFDWCSRFLSYYPLKQGLKLRSEPVLVSVPIIFILLSIKTRIETPLMQIKYIFVLQFLSYYPLKQGLKLYISNLSCFVPLIFILLSIKTRIETISWPATGASLLPYFYPTIH